MSVLPKSATRVARQLAATTAIQGASRRAAARRRILEHAAQTESSDTLHFLQVVTFDMIVNEGGVEAACALARQIITASAENDLSDRVALRLIVDCRAPEVAMYVVQQAISSAVHWQGHIGVRKRDRLEYLQGHLLGNAAVTNAPDLLSRLRQDCNGSAMLATLSRSNEVVNGEK